MFPEKENDSGFISAYNTTGKSLIAVTSVGIKELESPGAKSIRVAWEPKEDVTGYYIQISTSKTFAKGNKSYTISNKAQAEKLITGLSSGKTYYVRMRAYNKVGSTKYYSVYSEKQTVKTL